MLGVDVDGAGAEPGDALHMGGYEIPFRFAYLIR
jgi:hypothetical protein